MLIAVLLGCGHTPTAKPHVPLAKVEAKPPVSLVTVRDSREKEQRSIVKIETKVETVNRELLSANQKLDAAVKEADRLRQQRKATEQELTDQWTRLSDLRGQYGFSQQETADALKEAANRRQIADALGIKLNDLDRQIREKNEEAAKAQLTIQNSENLRKASDDAGAAKDKKILDLTADLNRALPYRNAVWMLAGAWALFTVVKLVLAKYGIRLPF